MPKSVHRRSFIRAAAGAAAAALWADETLEAYQEHVNTNSKPSDLKITDLRVATLARAPMTDPIIRIDTNQGIYGLGEVRDGASKNYALMLKSRLLSENPCNIDKLFRKVKQFGSHSRQAGGVWFTQEEIAVHLADDRVEALVAFEDARGDGAEAGGPARDPPGPVLPPRRLRTAAEDLVVEFLHQRGIV